MARIPSKPEMRQKRNVSRREEPEDATFVNGRASFRGLSRDEASGQAQTNLQNHCARPER